MYPICRFPGLHLQRALAWRDAFVAEDAEKPGQPIRRGVIVHGAEQYYRACLYHRWRCWPVEIVVESASHTVSVQWVVGARGVARLPKTHHSYRISNFSRLALHDDFVRITGACPMSLLDDNHWGEDMIDACVSAGVTMQRSASITAPGISLPKGKGLAPDCCPSAEAEELDWYHGRLKQTIAWIDAANKRLDTAVSVGAVLLDAERWLRSEKNASWNAALIGSSTHVQRYRRAFARGDLAMVRSGWLHVRRDWHRILCSLGVLYTQ